MALFEYCCSECNSILGFVHEWQPQLKIICNNCYAAYAKVAENLQLPQGPTMKEWELHQNERWRRERNSFELKNNVIMHLMISEK